MAKSPSPRKTAPYLTNKTLLEQIREAKLQGRVTDRLARSFMLLVDRISKKPNWRGYSYLDEMKAFALECLVRGALKFDETRCKYPNPFAYYTTITINAFRRILNQETKVRGIRDRIMLDNGMAPSISAQVEMEGKYSQGY